MHALLVSAFLMVAPAPAPAPTARPTDGITTQTEALRALAHQALEAARSAGIDLVTQPSLATVLARATTR